MGRNTNDIWVDSSQEILQLKHANGKPAVHSDIQPAARGHGAKPFFEVPRKPGTDMSPAQQLLRERRQSGVVPIRKTRTEGRGDRIGTDISAGIGSGVIASKISRQADIAIEVISEGTASAIEVCLRKSAPGRNVDIRIAQEELFMGKVRSRLYMRITSLWRVWCVGRPHLLNKAGGSRVVWVSGVD